MHFTTRDLSSLLLQRMAQRGTRPAFTCNEVRTPWNEVVDDARAFTRALQDHSIHDELVVVMLPSTPSLGPLILALWGAGTGVALCSPKYQAHELQQITSRMDLRWVLTAQDHTPHFTSLGFHHSGTLDLKGTRIEVLHRPSSPPCAAGDVALIKFSSGSTGEPKGVALSPAHILAESDAIITSLALSSDDRILCPVPLYHSYGFDLGLLSALASGAELHTVESFVPRAVLKAIESERITIFLGVPTMYRFMLDTTIARAPDLTTVRMMLSCTAPLSPKLIQDFSARFGVPICQHYGSSEAGAVTVHAPSEVLSRSGSVGRPMTNVEITIVDESGTPVRPGCEGEIIVQSPAVARGYLSGAPVEQATLSNGTFRTGDRGFLDEAGFLHLTGRTDAMINVGGLKVSPLEVSQLLESHPAVREAATIGITSTQGEQLIYSAVTVRSTATSEELTQFCRAHLAEYKVPRIIDIRKELPRGPTGKIRLRPEDVS